MTKGVNRNGTEFSQSFAKVVRKLCGGFAPLRLITIIATILPLQLFSQTPIRGEARVGAEAMTAFVQAVNPDFDPAIAEAFISVGERYGLRGDVAMCQAVIETGWFKYEGGTAVTPDQHNYCGLGVTRKGLKGCSFDTVEEGVRAMMQHLWAYTTADPLDDDIVDPRYKLVTRGSAPHWEDLSNRWAMNPRYGTDILNVYSRLLASNGIQEQEIETIEVIIPEEIY